MHYSLDSSLTELTSLITICSAIIGMIAWLAQQFIITPLMTKIESLTNKLSKFMDNFNNYCENSNKQQQKTQHEVIRLQIESARYDEDLRTLFRQLKIKRKCDLHEEHKKQN